MTGCGCLASLYSTTLSEQIAQATAHEREEQRNAYRRENYYHHVMRGHSLLRRGGAILLHWNRRRCRRNHLCFVCGLDTCKLGRTLVLWAHELQASHHGALPHESRLGPTRIAHRPESSDCHKNRCRESASHRLWACKQNLLSWNSRFPA